MMLGKQLKHILSVRHVFAYLESEMVEIVIVLSLENSLSEPFLQPIDVQLISKWILLANKKSNWDLISDSHQMDYRNNLGAIMSNIVCIVSIVVFSECTINNVLCVMQNLFCRCTTLWCRLLKLISFFIR